MKIGSSLAVAPPTESTISFLGSFGKWGFSSERISVGWRGGVLDIREITGRTIPDSGQKRELYDCELR